MSAVLFSMLFFLANLNLALRRSLFRISSADSENLPNGIFRSLAIFKKRCTWTLNNEPVDTWGHIANMSQLLNYVFKELFGIILVNLRIMYFSNWIKLGQLFLKPFIIFTSILSMSAVFSASSKNLLAAFPFVEVPFPCFTKSILIPISSTN